MGTTAATLVPAIKEITDELGAVTAGNLGTTSSTITTAIKEVVDGTGAATVTVAGIASQQPTGKLDSVSATKQTIIGDIDFNSPNNAATTTLKFGTGTVLDVSAGTLKMSDATAAFNISSTFLNLQGTSNAGQGLQIDRSTITGANVSTGNDAFFQWKEASISTDNPASAHNQNDIAWQIRGLTSATSPVHYTQANVDFQNAYRLFGIGSGGNANSMTNVTVAWDDADKNFDISLNDTTTDMTSGSAAGTATYGATAKIPQITVDRQGRISAMTEVDMSGFLGTFNVLGDTGTQTVAATNNLNFVGTAGEIETAVTDVSGTKTVTIGLPDNVDIDGTFGAAGNVTLASGNASDSTIAIGGTNTTTTIAGTLNIPGTLNVTGTTNTGTIQSTTLTAGSNSTAGSIIGDWTLTRGSTLNATYADLAEKYTADADYEAGTVVLFAGEAELTVCGNHASHAVAGIITTNPAQVYNAECTAGEGEFVVELALIGRVPCKVIGPVHKGDLIVSSEAPGFGCAADLDNLKVGTIIGKAITGYNGDTPDGVCEVLVGKN